MYETRYINEDGICHYSRRVDDEGNTAEIRSGPGINIPQQCPMRPGDSLTIISSSNSCTSCTITVS